MRTLPDGILILDGATGTELDRRGVDVRLPLWSARALLDAPEAVEQIHADYLRAGAGALTTNTFRAHGRSLAKGGLGGRARELTRIAVDLAKSARAKVNPDALILGSVAPLEDCYRPDLAPTEDVCRVEHEAMITHLLEADVDLIILETANTRHEVIAAAEVARRLAPGRWMASFCTKTDGPPGVMLHGAPLVDVLPAMEGAVAIGVNCVDTSTITPQIRLLRALLPAGVRIVAYGNIGHADEAGNWISGEGTDPSRYADFAEAWIATGATIIGGCCGTTPETIRAVAERIAAR